MPVAGEQAGRISDPETIVARIDARLNPQGA
jgi:hypothetical protein